MSLLHVHSPAALKISGLGIQRLCGYEITMRSIPTVGGGMAEG